MTFLSPSRGYFPATLGISAVLWRRGLSWVTLLASLAAEQVALIGDLTPWRYLLTQPDVIVRLLATRPSGRSRWFSMTDRPPTGTVLLRLPSAVVVLSLVGRRSWRSIGDGGWWGFGAPRFLLDSFAPTSSIIPLGDIAFEHRMYLPLAAVVVLAVLAGHQALAWGLRRLAAPRALLDGWRSDSACGRSAGTVSATARSANADYRDDLTMWTETSGQAARQSSRASQSCRCHGPVNISEALPHFVEALRLKLRLRRRACQPRRRAVPAREKLDEALTHFSTAGTHRVRKIR